MDISEIISSLKDKFGDKLDVAKVTEMFKGQDMSKLSMTEIIAKVKTGGGILGDLDGDGVVENPLEELKGKASKLFGGIFGK